MIKEISTIYSKIAIVYLDKLEENALRLNYEKTNFTDQCDDLVTLSLKNGYYLPLDSENVLVLNNLSLKNSNQFFIHLPTKAITMGNSLLETDIEKMMIDFVSTFYENKSFLTNTCAVAGNDLVICPDIFTSRLPQGVVYISPAIGNYTYTISDDEAKIEFKPGSLGEIVAVFPGVVTDLGKIDELGNYLTIQNEKGDVTLYHHLSENIWVSKEDTIFHTGQLIGYASETYKNKTAYFSLIPKTGTIDYDHIFQYQLFNAKRINIGENDNYPYTIGDTELSEMKLILDNDNPYTEYSPNYEPRLEVTVSGKEKSYNDLMITAQVNDFPTLWINQSKKGEFTINKSYIFKGELKNKELSIDYSYIISVSEGKDLFADVNQDHQFQIKMISANNDEVFEGTYNVTEDILVNNSKGVISEDKISSIHGEVKRIAAIVINTDKKANELSKKYIDIFTDNKFTNTEYLIYTDYEN